MILGIKKKHTHYSFQPGDKRKLFMSIQEMAARHARNNGQDARVRLTKIGEEAFALIDPRALLAKIGKEAFDLLDGIPLPGPGRRPHAAPLHQEHQYHRRHHQDHNQKQHSDCVYQYHRAEAVTVKQKAVITREY